MEMLETYDKLIAITVDVQNDFCPGGSLAVAEGDQIVVPLNEVNRWVRAQNGAVIFTADWHPKETAHFVSGGGPWPEHCLQHKAGAAFHDNLEVLPGDTVAYKGTGTKDDGYSGFGARFDSTSPLHARGMGRADHNVETVSAAVKEAARIYGKVQQRVAVIVGGLATDYCVKATVLDSLIGGDGPTNPKYTDNVDVYVLEDAMRAVDAQPGDGDRAIAEMRACGAIMIKSADVLNNNVLQVRG